MTANTSPIAEYADSITPREQILAGAVYLTDEAAKVLRCQPSTIRHAIRTGMIRGKGRPYRILGAELLKFAGGAA